MADVDGQLDAWVGHSSAQFTSSGGSIIATPSPWTGVGSASFPASEILVWGTGFTFSGIGQVITNEEPLDWINRLPVPRPTPEIDFTWIPRETPLTYVFGGVTFNTFVSQTRTGIPITFTATAKYPDFHRWWAVWYWWDFGDGTNGWGSVVTHTYTIANPYAEATLAVKDNYGNVVTVSRRLLLVHLSDLRVVPNIVVETA